MARVGVHARLSRSPEPVAAGDQDYYQAFSPAELRHWRFRVDTRVDPFGVEHGSQFQSERTRANQFGRRWIYRNRTGRNVRKHYKQTMREISRTFDNGKVDLGVASMRTLIDAFADSNRWMNERYEIPMPVGPDGDIVTPAPASSSWLDLEAVFSTATLSLIDTLCEAESRRSWSFFLDPRRWLRDK